MKRNLNIINNFKGIWIPKEILYDNNLNYFEKMLFSDRILKEWNNWDAPRTRKHMVRPTIYPRKLLPITKIAII